MKNVKEIYLLAVIGAGEGGFPILQKARELDYVRTLAFGQADSLAKDLADEFVVCDINDRERIVAICKEHHVDGVIGTSESTTEATALIAHQLGLPGNDVNGGFGASNKYVMRQRVSRVKSIKQPVYSLYEEGAIYHYPIVAKALDSCGKRGISVVRSAEELPQAIAYACEYSTDGHVLMEQYLEGGKEYSIECLAGGGHYQIIQFTEKESSGAPHFVETAHHQPADINEEMKAKIRVAVPDVLKAIGINCGLAHLELKNIENEIYFIEVGARGGGDHIADTLTVNSTDFDYFKGAIDCCLGLYEYKEAHTKAYTGIYFHCKQNAQLRPLFEAAPNANWCIANTVTSTDFSDAETNVGTAQSGYIIYCSNHKITLKDA